MDTQRLLTLARLIDELDVVEGRTRLQKVVHLLGERFPKPFRHRFARHYFGPFSRELAAEIDFLVAARVLNEHTPAESVDGHFRYTIADEETRRRVVSVTGHEAPDWVDSARRLNGEDKSTLEALSTFVFLRRRLAPEAALLRREFERVKPHSGRQIRSRREARA